MAKKTTVIRVSRATADELRRLKVHPREPYDDVIRRALEGWRGGQRSRS
jgi:hypothetical protein